MTLYTTDLPDAFEDRAASLALAWRDYGGQAAAAGRAATLLVFEDNAQVRAALETPGEGRILVVAGGGSMRSALVGGNLAKLAAKNGWAGIVVDGTVRDERECRAEPVCIKALGTAPRKSSKAGAGAVDVPVLIGGAIIRPGDLVVMDGDGVIRLPADPDILAKAGL